MRAPSYGALMTSWWLHMMEPSCHCKGSTWWCPHDGMRSFIFVHHEGSIMWSPHDVMRAPHDGALMMGWKVYFFSVMRTPSCGALMTLWGLHYDGALMMDKSETSHATCYLYICLHIYFLFTCLLSASLFTYLLGYLFTCLLFYLFIFSIINTEGPNLNLFPKV